MVGSSYYRPQLETCLINLINDFLTITILWYHLHYQMFEYFSKGKVLSEGLMERVV